MKVDRVSDRKQIKRLKSGGKKEMASAYFIVTVIFFLSFRFGFQVSSLHRQSWNLDKILCCWLMQVTLLFLFSQRDFSFFLSWNSILSSFPGISVLFLCLSHVFVYSGCISSVSLLFLSFTFFCLSFSRMIRSRGTDVNGEGHTSRQINERLKEVNRLFLQLTWDEKMTRRTELDLTLEIK